tara:strand:- start:528 stop:734 length:207 start_codon:yes stop_codon:yes gene_type:complete
MSDTEKTEDITVLKAHHMADNLHDEIAFGLCCNDLSAKPEVDQLLCIAIDHLSIARHTLKLAYLKESM